MKPPIVNLNLQLLRAEQIAHEAHAGVKRKLTDEDYINHPRRVASIFPHDIRLQIIAWLHDVVEDNQAWTLERLRSEFPEDILSVLDAVTRRKAQGESYKDFILRIKNHSEDAIKIKLADLKDNLRDLPLNDSLRTRYLLALEELES